MEDKFLTPPPFVRCDECEGTGFSDRVNGWGIPCNKCSDGMAQKKGFSGTGWLPQYYTPEQYRDWIRRENDLPDYELPPDTKIYVRSKEGARSWYLTGTMWEYTDGNRFDPRYYWVVIDTIASRPPKDYHP